MASPHRVVLLVLLVVISWGLMSFREPRELVPVDRNAPILGALYARPVEEVETHVLQRGETLSGVLSRASITGGDMANLLLALREYKSPRELRDGSEVTVRRWVDSGRPRAVEVRVNADSTVRLDHSPIGWASSVVVTPTTIDTLYLAGQIHQGQSLYHAIIYNEDVDLALSERRELVGELASIYEFKLNFAQDIQPGDRYELVYEREARPDGTARRRRVLIAEMLNNGKQYPAIYFLPEGRDGGGYYDREGASLRQGFSRNPVDYVRITSSFSWNRYHPVLGIYRGHLGTDFGAPTGTPVKATGDGTVVSAGVSGGYGNLVEIRHAGGYTTRYAHLSRFGAGIRAGRGVKQGEVIGYVGATGLATGPHLHYELRRNGQPLDARTAKLPGGPPLPQELRGEFDRIVRQRIALMQDLSPLGPRLARAGDQGLAAGTGEI